MKNFNKQYIFFFNPNIFILKELSFHYSPLNLNKDALKQERNKISHLIPSKCSAYKRLLSAFLEGKKLWTGADRIRYQHPVIY